MIINKKGFLVFFFFVIVFGLFLSAWVSPENDINIQGQQQTPMAPSLSNGQGALIDLPEGASQLEVGKEVYRLICSACHAYDGTGLTEEWIATWNPEDQNCWQSKCHGFNHPEDGFYLPDSPPVVGNFVPYLFPTAMDMFSYIIQEMPWQDPGTLPEDQAWAVTAYVLKLNGFTPLEDLGPHNGQNFVLPTPVQNNQPTHSPSIMPTTIVKPTEPIENAPSEINKFNSFEKTILFFGFLTMITIAGLTIYKLRNK